MTAPVARPRDAVVKAFPAFTEKWEGCLTWMYLDILGLVTTGRGNLIDPVTAAHALPWKQAVGAGGNFGALATFDQVTDEWIRVKKLQNMKEMGGGAFKSVTTLRLSPDDVDALTTSKMLEMWANLLKRPCFAAAGDAPCDAQLGLLSMAWAMGPAFYFPAFQGYFQAADWSGCQAQCHMNAAGNPGLVPRNNANHLLFGNAAFVSDHGLDPEMLYYPHDVTPPASGAV